MPPRLMSGADTHWVAVPRDCAAHMIEKQQLVVEEGDKTVLWPNCSTVWCLIPCR